MLQKTLSLWVYKGWGCYNIIEYQAWYGTYMGGSRFFQIADFCVARPRVSQLGEKKKGSSLTDWIVMVHGAWHPLRASAAFHPFHPIWGNGGNRGNRGKSRRTFGIAYWVAVFIHLLPSRAKWISSFQSNRLRSSGLLTMILLLRVFESTACFVSIVI